MKYFNCPSSILAGSLLLLASLFGVPASWAQEGKPPAVASNLTAAAENSFNNDGSEYVWRSDLRAVKKAEESVVLHKEGRSPAAAGEAMVVKDILGEKGRFTIYKPLPALPAAGDAIRRVLHNRRHIPTFPIVMNKVTKGFGIVTDDLMLKLKDPETALAIAEEYGLIFSYMNDLIQTAVYKISGEVNIRELRERLMHDPRIERVTLGIVDHIRRPR